MPNAVIVDYESSWPERAQQVLAEVQTALAPLSDSARFTYEHIGSTAVPGLAAKPIIDLQVRMPSLPSLDQLAGLLAPTGFVSAQGARPDSPGVYRDTPRPADPTDPTLYEKRLFHDPARAAILHIRRADSPFAQFVVVFRDWLRSNPVQAGIYEEAKRRLATQHASDRDYDDYTRSKSAFFDETNDEMRSWARRQSSRPHLT
ncbi:GrpB family protein [Pseudonocardia sp. DSM 110487]|uniref:GrpB family protein n=1 Tax=Pseudonocardia sp. DSM 110487 TaxID=2865833 RepID=UPI001C696471|nr:GrpB family protein [Pseudonocardia sp. DSM 110487]QYN34869.1 GrpB family protein [Pseudonocardia sp. DSM 110487]